MAPFRSVSFISEYLRERMMPSALPWKAARTASRTPSGEHLLWVGSNGWATEQAFSVSPKLWVAVYFVFNWIEYSFFIAVP